MSSEKSLPPPDKASEIEIEIRVKGPIDEAATEDARRFAGHVVTAGWVHDNRIVAFEQP